MRRSLQHPYSMKLKRILNIRAGHVNTGFRVAVDPAIEVVSRINRRVNLLFRMFLSSSSSWVGRMLSRLKSEWHVNQCEFVGHFNFLSLLVRDLKEAAKEREKGGRERKRDRPHGRQTSDSPRRTLVPLSRIIFARDSCYFKLDFRRARFDRLISAKRRGSFSEIQIRAPLLSRDIF